MGVRQIGAVPIATLLPAHTLTLNTIYNVYLTERTDFAIEFVLAVINSTLLRWYWRKEFFDQKRTFPKVKKSALLSIPIPKLNMERRADVELHDHVVQFVRQMVGIGATRAVGRSRLDIEAQLNDMIFRAFKLSKSEIDSIIASERTSDSSVSD